MVISVSKYLSNLKKIRLTVKISKEIFKPKICLKSRGGLNSHLERDANVKNKLRCYFIAYKAQINYCRHGLYLSYSKNVTKYLHRTLDVILFSITYLLSKNFSIKANRHKNVWYFWKDILYLRNKQLNFFLTLLKNNPKYKENVK